MERYTIKKPDSIKKKKRVGIGPSSGHGKTSCRGQKGQMSRSGSKHRAWFEGGQMPLQRRVPKRGFNNIFKKEYQIVNISSIEKFEITKLPPKFLKRRGLLQTGTNSSRYSLKVNAQRLLKLQPTHSLFRQLKR